MLRTTVSQLFLVGSFLCLGACDHGVGSGSCSPELSSDYNEVITACGIEQDADCRTAGREFLETYSGVDCDATAAASGAEFTIHPGLIEQTTSGGGVGPLADTSLEAGSMVPFGVMPESQDGSDLLDPLIDP